MWLIVILFHGEMRDFHYFADISGYFILFYLFVENSFRITLKGTMFSARLLISLDFSSGIALDMSFLLSEVYLDLLRL